jgi:hypothetical protein
MIRRLNNWIALTGLLGFASLNALAGPSTEQVRSAALEYLQEGRQTEGIEKMTAYLSQQLGKTSRVGTRELAELAATAECVRFLEIMKSVQVDPKTAEWILGSGARLHVFLETFRKKDKPKPCVAIMDQLRRHDPAGADEYYNLILSIAVILDRPRTSPIHGQMGREKLPPEDDAIALYDYYKELYASGDGKIAYEALSPSDLVFVVHAPAPISELKWARENTNGSLSGWGKKYSDIEYDTARLNGSRFSWDHGLYTLADIAKRGGICVDQAYFSVLTARAWGIPAIYFHGSGKSANHAWFGFMKSPGEWDLDVGRYANSSYTTGYAIDYQIGDTMTDHDVEFMRERSGRDSSSFARASAYASIASVLEKNDPESALQCAREARHLEKRMLKAWEIELRVLIAKKDYDGLIELFAEKKDAFRKYPDILVESAKEISAALTKGGRNDDAVRISKSLSGAVKDDRDDLTRSFENQRIERIIASGDMKKARKEMEQMLDDQKDQGNKIFSIIRDYITLTKKSGQTREAVRFLDGYVDDLLENYNFPPAYEAGLLSQLRSAYKNNGDSKEVAELDQRIERLKYR